MLRKTALAVAGAALLISPVAALAQHPAGSSNCEECHLYGTSPEAPKVIPEKASFIDQIFGAVNLQGHPKISCTGGPTPDGKLSGCHSIELGKPKFLAADLNGKPVDALCEKCHGQETNPGAHHPSYKVDKNGDGVPEHFVTVSDNRPSVVKFAPKLMAEPQKSYPDAISFTVTPEGVKKLGVAIPLEKFTEVVDKQPKVFERVVTCASCHNPHYGFLIETGKMETFEKTARKQGDALLRMRDQDNVLCLACHN